jgi:translocation and assembly module TamA
LVVLALGALIGSGGAVALAEEDEGIFDPPAQETTPARVDYELTITGVEDRELRDLLESASQLRALVKRPPATIAGLERRVRDDLARLQAVMKSEGYYAATLRYEIDSAARPTAVRMNIVPGTRYTIAAFEIGYTGTASPSKGHRPTLQDIGIRLGMPARAPTVKLAERKALTVLGERGYAFAKSEDLNVVVSHADQRMTIRLSVDSGRQARFGQLTITGPTDVEEDYIRRLVTWNEGDVYDRRLIASTRSALSETNLFSSIKISTAPKLESDRRLPVTIELSERPRRSIGAGVSYSTDVGFGGEVFWEHRNILRRNERLRLTLKGAQIEQSGKLEFRKPTFLSRRQALLSEASVVNSKTEAYDQRSVAATVALERRYPSYWRATIGVTGAYDRVVDNEGVRDFQLFGLPITALRNATDDPLNPTRGVMLDLSATPYVGVGDETLRFVRLVAGGSSYHAIDKAKKFVLAGRARAGSLVGAKTVDIPADKRFYAGGGGSIRGYKFQQVGPLDAANDPVGGRSLIEFSGELRIRISDKFGIVPFVDGGTVVDASYPTFDEPVRWAAGLGLRYFTGFGPLRADVAFPINGRDGVDSRFEFYISIGQAF